MYIIQHHDENARLPAEILTEIFKKLSNETLFICLSVCKSWFHPAGQIYYRQLHMSENTKESAGIKELIQYITHSPDLLIGDKVRGIQIEGQRQIGGRIISSTSAAAVSSKEQLQSLLCLCPHLQELAFSINSVYWKHVYEMGHHITDFIRPRRLYTVGKLRCYEEEHFYKVAHQFRSSIHELDIHCSCDASIHQGFGSLYSYLADFPLITVLSIKSGSQRYMIHLNRLLDSCKRLKKLDFQLDHPFFEQQPYSDQQSWPEYVSLQELDVYQSNFNVQQLQYIIHRFKNLKNFTLRMNQIDLHQKKLWKNEEGKHMESAARFFKYGFMKFVAHLDQLHLHFNILGRSYVEHLVEYIYLPSLFSDDEDRCVCIDASFEVNHGRAERTQIEIHKDGQKQMINYTFVRDFSEPEATAAVEEGQQTEPTQHLPYLTHLESYGRHIQSLHIATTAKAKHTEAADIDLVLRLCPNLRQLTIVVDISPATHFSPEMNHQHPPSHCWNYNHKSALGSKLISLTVKGITITKEIVQAIARHHPGLKNVSFINCVSESCIGSDPLAQSNLSFYMYDLSNLHLESLVFDIFTHRCGKKLTVPMVCVAIESKDKSCNYYYLAKQQKDPVTDELFNSISTATYTELITDKAAVLTVVWFKVKALDNLELRAGRNQSFNKKVQPR